MKAEQHIAHLASQYGLNIVLTVVTKIPFSASCRSLRERYKIYRPDSVNTFSRDLKRGFYSWLFLSLHYMPGFSPSLTSEIRLCDWPSLEYTFFHNLCCTSTLLCCQEILLLIWGGVNWKGTPKSSHNPPQLLLFSGKGWPRCVSWRLQNSCATLIPLLKVTGKRHFCLSKRKKSCSWHFILFRFGTKQFCEES